MTLLILGLVLFLGTHSIRIFAEGWRTAMIGRMGTLPWKGLIAVLSLVGFVSCFLFGVLFCALIYCASHPVLE